MNNERETDGERIRKEQKEAVETNGLRDKIVCQGSNNLTWKTDARRFRRKTPKTDITVCANTKSL